MQWSVRQWWNWVVARGRIAAQTRFFVPMLLLIIALGFSLPRIDYPERYLFDEILFAYSAGEYAEGNAAAYAWDHPCSTFKSDDGCAEAVADARQESGRIGKYQWDHPPLGKLLIAGGILVFGNDAFGWRIASAITGAIGIAVVYCLGVRLSGRVAIGLLAAALLLLDGLYFIYSRMGLVDIFVTVLMMSALFTFAGYLQARPDQIRWPLFQTGLLLGLGIATKWNAAYVGAGVGVVILWRLGRLAWRVRRGEATSEQRRGLQEHLYWVPLALGAMPLAIYILSYSQFFLEGYSVSQFIALQREMFSVHSSLGDYTDLASRWWEWPLALSNVWFGQRSFADGRVATTYANGNPILYWAFLPAIAWVCVRMWRMRSPALIVIAIGFFGQWLPWLFIERSTYTYHFLPAVPFGCLAVAMAVVHICQTMPDWRRTLAIEYLVLVAVAFIFFYPIYSFYPISEFELALRLWFPSWR